MANAKTAKLTKSERTDLSARERMCIVTRQRAGDADLIRFVLDPQGVLIPDLKAVLPGRGAWVTGQSAVLGEAIKRKAFARALKAEQSVGRTHDMGLDDLVERTHSILAHHARGSLAMARKAGLVVNGFSKVESALKSGKAHAVLHASDAGADGVMKLNRLAGHVGVPVLQLLPHGEMGLALGQEHVIHAALLDGPGAARFLAPLRRLEGFCQTPGKSGANRNAPNASDNDLSTQQATGLVLGDKTAV
jgi:hypothetical protein